MSLPLWGVGLGCLLTTVALMQAVDTPRYAADIERIVAKLVSVDSNRSGYYKDLCKSQHKK